MLAEQLMIVGTKRDRPDVTFRWMVVGHYQPEGVPGQ